MHRENWTKLRDGPRTQVCDTGSDVSVWPAVAGVSPDKAGGPMSKAVETFYYLPDATTNHGVVYSVTKTSPNHFNWVGGGVNYLYRSNDGYKWVTTGYTPKKEATND